MGQNQIPILPSLTSVSLSTDDVQFNKIQTWLVAVGQLVRTLKLWIDKCGIDYLDATRWKELIEKHMANLRKFHLTSHPFEEVENLSLLDLIKRFRSPF